MERPPHAYLPGRTARHPEGLFDAMKEIAVPLADSPAWATGLRFLRAGYYWEAHEVLEAVWMAAPERSGEKAAVQGAIQIANAALKARMGQGRATERLLRLADGLLAEAERLGGLAAMRLEAKDVTELRDLVEHESGSGCAL